VDMRAGDSVVAFQAVCCSTVHDWVSKRAYGALVLCRNSFASEGSVLK
jgi:hypothetical protein